MQFNLSYINDVCGNDDLLPECELVADEYHALQKRDHGHIDWIVFSLYLTALAVIGLMSACYNRGSLNGFFLTSQSASWLLVGISMFASNIGSGHFIGELGSASATGISVAVYELNAIFILPLLGWVFGPVFLASGASTMPEYLRARFGGRRIEIYTSCLALITYIFTKISVDLYAGALTLDIILGIDHYLGVFILLLLAAVFTIIGGMTAVLWANVFQTIVMVTGSIVLLVEVLDKNLLTSHQENAMTMPESMSTIEVLYILFLNAVPASPNNVSNYIEEEQQAINVCSHPPGPETAFHIMQPPDGMVTPWPGVVLGLSILSTWYWCSDQMMVQHILASRNLSHAKFGSILTAILKFLACFTFVLPGLAARVLHKEIVACADPILCCCFCKKRTSCSDYAYPLLGKNMTDDGLRGLMVITVMAAVISSFMAIFNACSTIFTIDIWSMIRPKASRKELQIVGRVFIVIVCTISMLWMVIISHTSILYNYIQSMTSYFAPPLTAIFLLAVFWKRCNEQGAFYGLMIGLLVGMVRLGLALSYPDENCAIQSNKRDLRPPAYKNVHFLYFAVILFGITAIVTICLSLVTKPPDALRINGLTFWTRYQNRIIKRRRKVKTGANEGNGHLMGSQNDLEPENTATRQRIRSTVSAGDSMAGINNAGTKTSKWQRTFNWLCGIEKTGINHSDSATIRQSSSALDGLANNNSNNIGNSRKGEGNEGGYCLLPISPRLIEDPSVAMASSVALVALITGTIFFWILLW